MHSKNLKRLTRSALIAALYFVLSVSVPALSFGAVQFRFSEALCILPALFPEAIIGLTVGCVLANVFSPFGILDIVLGSLATLIGAVLTYVFHKKTLIAAIPPILSNALIVPLIWVINQTDMLYWLNMLTILASEAVIIYALGIPLATGLKKALSNEVLESNLPKIRFKRKTADEKTNAFCENGESNGVCSTYESNGVCSSKGSDISTTNENNGVCSTHESKTYKEVSNNDCSNKVSKSD